MENIESLLNLLYSCDSRNRMVACHIIRISIESGEHDLEYYQKYIPNLSGLHILEKVYENEDVDKKLNGGRSDVYCLVPKKIDELFDFDLLFTGFDILHLFFPLKMVLQGVEHIYICKCADVAVENDEMGFSSAGFLKSELDVLDFFSTSDHEELTVMYCFYERLSDKCINTISYKTVLNVLNYINNVIADISDLQKFKTTPDKTIRVVLTIPLRFGSDECVEYISKHTLSKVEMDVLHNCISNICTNIIETCNKLEISIWFCMGRSTSTELHNTEFLEIGAIHNNLPEHKNEIYKLLVDKCWGRVKSFFN